MKGNCGTHTFTHINNNKEVYSIVLQSHDEDGELVSNTCPLAFQLSVIVDGCMYLFKNKKHRDDTYTYLMKNIDENRFDTKVLKHTNDPNNTYDWCSTEGSD